jgi:hypothetical protein
MNSPMPHQPYINRVTEAMSPSDWWTSAAETAPDGATCTLSAVLNWDHEVSPELYPYGLLLCWDLHTGWQWAECRRDKTNEYPEHLPLPLWARPADVAAAVRALLAGEDVPPATAEYDDAEVIAACQRWLNGDGDTSA